MNATRTEADNKLDTLRVNMYKTSDMLEYVMMKPSWVSTEDLLKYSKDANEALDSYNTALIQHGQHYI